MKTLTEKLEKKITPEMEEKWMPKFEKQAGYRGNGVYNILGTNLFSTDTRELFLMFCASNEGIKLPNNELILRKTIKATTIEAIDKVLRSHKKFYISTDFPFAQLEKFFLTYKAKIMNKYLQEKGFTMVQAKDVDLNKLTGKSDIKVRANRNVWIKTEKFINYMK
jgi:hypothetical protein